MTDKRMTRRLFLQASTAAASAALLAACAPAATQAPAASTTAPVATLPPAQATNTAAPAVAATATPEAAATSAGPVTINWDVYPKTDPRHWAVPIAVDVPKKYENLKISEFMRLTAEQHVVDAGSAYRCTRVGMSPTIL